MTQNKQDYKALNQILGSKMKQIRKSRKLSLKDISYYLEITPQQLQKYETNITQIPFSKLYLFIQALELDPTEFFNN